MVRRLRSKSLALGDAQPEARGASGELDVLVWEFHDLQAVTMERGREPIRQAGPGIWLSTVGDWVDIGAWLGQLLEGTDTLDAELQRLAQRWQDREGDPVDLAGEVTRYVSENIEYLAIEFGMGAFRPESASEVWQSRFGDCKDQANLVRVLLRELGVPSYLALVNGQHAGLIEKATPDYRHFNHVLLAVPRREGGYAFLDPTAPAITGGALPPSVRGREAFIVRPDGSEFVQIPAGSAGELELSFDLHLTPLGQIHGSLHVQGRGYQGTLLIETLARATDGQGGEALDRFLRHFLPESRVLETVEDVEGDRGAVRTLDAYLWVPATGRDQVAGLTVPFADLLLPELGERRRQTRFYQPQGAVDVRAVFHLPRGSHTATDPPPAFRVDATGVTTSAEWLREERSLKARLSYTSTRSLLGHAAFATLYEVRDRLQEWLAEPVIVHLDECLREESLEASVETLPRLRTAAGQLRLVDALYDEAENPVTRRAALARVADWFPEDSPSVFEARLEIAILDQQRGRAEDSVRDIREMLRSQADGVDAETLGWAEYLLADGLRLSGHPDEARAIYDRLWRDRRLSVHRRGWASARAAQIRRHSAPLEAVAILDEGTRLDSPALLVQTVLLVDILLDAAPLEEIDRRLDLIGSVHPHRIPEIHERLTREVTRYLDEGETARAERLVTLLVTRAETNPDLSFLSQQAVHLQGVVRDSVRCREIAARIEAYFRSQAPSWWSWTDADIENPRRETLISALEHLDRSGQAREFVRVATEVLTRFNIAPDFFGFLLFRCANHLDISGDDSELRDRFLSWCELLPESSRFRFAAATLRRDIQNRNTGQQGQFPHERGEP
jgi:hypothetical protein